MCIDLLTVFVKNMIYCDFKCWPRLCPLMEIEGPEIDWKLLKATEEESEKEKELDETAL